MEINSKEYWENRFKSGDWDERDGMAQTMGFATAFIKNLPSWLVYDINNNTETICDVGCAEGQLAAKLKNEFGQKAVCGIDFSQSAVDKAAQLYPNCSFKCDDINNINDKYDVIVCSNVLEHFSNPSEIIDKLLDCTNRHLIIMMPYAQDVIMYDEHESNFYLKSFRLIKNNFNLSDISIIDMRKTMSNVWNDLQVLAVYTKDEVFDKLNLTAEDIVGKYYYEIERLSELSERAKADADKSIQDAENVRADRDYINGEFIRVKTENEFITKELDNSKKELDNSKKELAIVQKNVDNERTLKENAIAQVQNLNSQNLALSSSNQLKSQKMSVAAGEMEAVMNTKSYKVSKVLRAFKQKTCGPFTLSKKIIKTLFGARGQFAFLNENDPLGHIVNILNQDESKITNAFQSFNISDTLTDSHFHIPEILQDDLKIRNTGKKRIAYITNQVVDWEDFRPRYGGGEKYLYNIASLLEEYGYEIDIYQPAFKDNETEYMGFKVITKKAGNSCCGFFVDNANEFYELTLDYDHVIYNMPEMSGAKYRKDAITICHGIWFDHNNYGNYRTKEWMEFLRRAFDNPLKIVSVDTNSINVIRSFFPELADKMQFIPNFVDLEQFSPPKEERNNEKLVILFPRRSQINRGSRILGEIIKNVPYDVEFYWVGEGDAQDTDLIKELAKKDSRLHYTNASFDEMPDWYRKADIAVIPTIACEGTSLSCIEAIASGCATVSTNVGGLTDIIYDNINGLLTDANPLSIAKAINKYITDETLRRNMQKAGREYAQYFSIKKWREKWTEVFEELKWIEKKDKSNPKIAILTKNALHGGVETLIAMEKEYLNADVIVTGGINNPENTCPFEYLYVDTYKGLLRELLKYDVVIYHWLPDWAVQAIKVSGVFSIEFVHRTDTSECDKSVPTLIASHSQYVLDYINKEYGNTQLHLVPNATDTDKYVHVDNRKNKNIIGAVTSYYSTKGIDILLKAWSMTDEKYRKNFKLVLHGAGTELEKFRELAQKLNLTNYELNPALNAPIELYDKLAAYVTAARIEGLPISVLEAMSADIPVIASDIDGHTVINSMLADKGFKSPMKLFKSEDAKALAKLLDEFMKNPYEVETHNMIETVFSKKSHCEGLKELIDKYYTNKEQ